MKNSFGLKGHKTRFATLKMKYNFAYLQYVILSIMGTNLIHKIDVKIPNCRDREGGSNICSEYVLVNKTWIDLFYSQAHTNTKLIVQKYTNWTDKKTERR